jgi:hypothetical protein
MVLGSTQPLTKMSTRNLPGGKRLPARMADNLTAICEPIVYRKCGSLNVSQPYGPPRPVTGIALHYLPLSCAETTYVAASWAVSVWSFPRYVSWGQCLMLTAVADSVYTQQPGPLRHSDVPCLAIAYWSELTVWSTEVTRAILWCERDSNSLSYRLLLSLSIHNDISINRFNHNGYYMYHLQ